MFEDVKDIKTNDIAQLYIILNREFRGASTNKNSLEQVCWMPRRLLYRKLTSFIRCSSLSVAESAEAVEYADGISAEG